MLTQKIHKKGSRSSTLLDFTPMWTPILHHTDVTKVRAKIDEITSAIRSNLSNDYNKGLLDGKTGFIVYFAYLSRYEQTDRYNDIIAQLIEECFEAINAGTFNRSTFCTGISGFLWALHHLKSEDYIDIDDHFELLTEMLSDTADRFGADTNFDFLHGASGIVFYLSHIHKHTNTTYLDAFIRHLQHEKIEDERTVKWISYMHNENNKPVYNLSLSHGMSSIIIILCTLLKHQPKHAAIKNLIRKAVHFIALQEKETSHQDESLFPSYVSDHGDKPNSRLSWCYGDIGNALAFLHAGQALNERHFIDEAHRIMIHNSHRRALKKNFILDAGMCHGAAGIAHIFNRFYQQIPDEAFKNAARYWLNVTLDMSVHEDGLAGYKAHNGINNGYTDSIGLLDGIVGVGLTLMAATSTIEPRWDRAFLLS